MSLREIKYIENNSLAHDDENDWITYVDNKDININCWHCYVESEDINNIKSDTISYFNNNMTYKMHALTNQSDFFDNYYCAFSNYSFETLGWRYNNIVKFEPTKKLNYTYQINTDIADLINKVASNPDRYIGIFRPTTPELKLIQNITQSHEISFGDFVEDIITVYLGKYYKNLPKRATYKGETILFDQLFEYNNKIFMIEQKMRDDHDSTKKRGQFENFIKKVEYLKETYPNKEIEAGITNNFFLYQGVLTGLLKDIFSLIESNLDSC